MTLHELNEEANDIKLMVLSTSDLTDWTEAEIWQLTVKSDGTLVLWGNNSNGVIGNGKNSDTYASAYTVIKLK